MHTHIIKMIFSKRCILSLLVALLWTSAVKISHGQETLSSTLAERKSTCDPGTLCSDSNHIVEVDVNVGCAV